MSRNDWEGGTLRLPTAEFSRVRKAVESADAEFKKRVFDHTQKFWGRLTRKQQTDPRAYLQAMDAYLANIRGPRHPGVGHTYADHLASAVGNLLGWKVGDRYSGRQLHKPTRVLKSEVSFPTNRTTEFWGSGATVTFDRAKSTVEYHSGEGNRQVERAKTTPIVVALLEVLDTVRWTGRQTGGQFLGNDEYNEDREEGGWGDDYVTVAFGPAGLVQSPSKCRPFTDSRGRRTGEAELAEATRKRMEDLMDFSRRTGMSVRLI